MKDLVIQFMLLYRFGQTSRGLSIVEFVIGRRVCYNQYC
jgi:hypothetical protein